MPEKYESKPGGGIHPLYAVTIHHCICRGDLREMKALVEQAEKFLHDHGDVGAALEALKLEVLKLEKK